ncbi:MAG: SIS domain-containing protein [archaeon]
MKEKIIKQLKESAEVKEKCVICADSIECAVTMIIKCFKSGNKLLLCGNGGSAADSQHIAAEFVNKFRFDRDPLPAIALTTDSSILSSVGNDSSFSYVFEKQIRAIGKEGDLLIISTTSDFEKKENSHSSNLYFALRAAKERGLGTIGFVSQKSKEILNQLDVAIQIPSKDTPRIQEAHLTIAHIICDLVEQRMFPNE